MFASDGPFIFLFRKTFRSRIECNECPYAKSEGAFAMPYHYGINLNQHPYTLGGCEQPFQPQGSSSNAYSYGYDPAQYPYIQENCAQQPTQPQKYRFFIPDSSGQQQRNCCWPPACCYWPLICRWPQSPLPPFCPTGPQGEPGPPGATGPQGRNLYPKPLNPFNIAHSN